MILVDRDETRHTPHSAHTQSDEHRLCFDMPLHCLQRDHHPEVYANIPPQSIQETVIKNESVTVL